MSRAAIRQALETRLASLSPSWPTAWENTKFTPPAGQPWQRATLMFADTRAMGIGAGAPEHWQGHLHVQIWVPSGQGAQTAEARFELLAGRAGHFQRGMVLSAGGVHVTILQPTSRPALTTEPQWYGLPCLVPFDCVLG